jgi:NAD(P)-dependent dehydrogenase (short-subunit alcohol dehydrogenase family)
LWLSAPGQLVRQLPDGLAPNISAVGRAGTPDEVGTVGALLMGPEGAFITGSDFLMDGGVTAAYWYGELCPS